MLAFVDIEHEKNTTDPVKEPPHQQGVRQRADNIAAAVGLPCATVHYRDFSLDWLRKNAVRAFFISGNTPDWIEYDWEAFKPLQTAFRSGEYPVMAFCGGHQLVGMTFGADCNALGPLESGEIDLVPDYHPGMRKERGYLPMQMYQPNHPLFKHFPATGPVLLESHYWELKELPKALTCWP